MSFKGFIAALLVCCSSGASFAQSSPSYAVSAATDLRPTEHTQGRVLCMKNGNTVVFFMEKDRRMITKVFDSTYKEIASVKYDSWLLNSGFLPRMVEGVYEMNDEAVMFVDKEINGKHTLIRLRFNSRAGAMIDEKVIAESRSTEKRVDFHIIKHREDEDYQVLTVMDNHTDRQTDMSITFYNARHDSVKTLRLPVADRGKYDNLKVVAAQSRPNGVLIALSLTQTMVYATGGSGGAITHRSSTDDHFLQFFYIPMDTKEARSSVLHLSTGVFPSSGHFDYNSFAQSLNFLLFSYRPVGGIFGEPIFRGQVSRDIFFKIDEHDIGAVGFNDIKDSKATEMLKQQVDSTKIYSPIPLRMYTDNNGRSTIFSTSYDYDRSNGGGTETYLQDIAITQTDDDGNEIWGTMLPVSQYYNYVRSFPRYSRQMLGVTPIRSGKNFYVIYNDYDGNFNNSLSKRGDTVFNFSMASGCYYKMDAKKNITKHHLFGDPRPDEHVTCFVSSAAFDYGRETYAALVQYKKGDDVDVRVAWSHLE